MDQTVLNDLPAISKARLPQTYDAAKRALAQCSRIDECQDWADKAEALASYARQAKDEEMRKMADRIQARAIRRCGELLKTYDAQGRRTELCKSDRTKSKTEAATEAGLSKFQKDTAVRLANIENEEFDEAVESENPPTVTALADRGKKPRPLIDIGDRSPAEFSISTQAQGHLREFAEFCDKTDAAEVVAQAIREDAGRCA